MSTRRSSSMLLSRLSRSTLRPQGRRQHDRKSTPGCTDRKARLLRWLRRQPVPHMSFPICLATEPIGRRPLLKQRYNSTEAPDEVGKGLKMIEESPNENPSVIYSFDGRWEEPLRRGEVRVFFRKRRPVRIPSRVFIYLGVPVKAIIGSAKVKSIKSVTLKEAIDERSDGAITENELIKYIGDKEYIHAIRIDHVKLFTRSFKLDELSRDFSFNPPQSFSIASTEIENALLGLSK